MIRIVFFVIILTMFVVSGTNLVYAENESINISNTDAKSYRPQLLVSDNQVYVVYTDQSTGNTDVFFTTGKMNEEFTNPINLSNNLGGSHFPRLAVSENGEFVTWYDYSPCKSDVFFSKIINDGTKFETSNLSNSAGVSYNPWIATSDNTIYVVWNDSTFFDGSIPNIESECQDGYDSTTHMNIMLATSTDNGNTFDFINLSNTAFAWNPRIAVSGNNVYIVWNQKTSSESDNIFFTKSTNSGKTFVEPINISNSANQALEAGIEIFENNVYIIWQESVSQEVTNIYFSKSSDDGISFSRPINLGNSQVKSQLTRDTQMVASDNEIFVVWYDETPQKYGVYLTKSEDYGQTFSYPINLSQDSVKTGYSQIVKNQQNIFVTWQEDISGNFEILLRQSTDGGKTFASTINLSNTEKASTLSVLGPQIAIDSNLVYVIWEDETAKGSDLFLTSFAPNLNDSFLSLQTTNGAVNVDLGINGEKIDTSKPVTFTLKFTDPTSRNILKNVHYVFNIEDSKENLIFSSSEQVAMDGIGKHTVTFSHEGPLIVRIDVRGIGIESVFDMKYSGETSAIITAVPEFSLVFVMLALTMIGVILIIKSRFHSLSISNF